MEYYAREREDISERCEGPSQSRLLLPDLGLGISPRTAVDSANLRRKRFQERAFSRTSRPGLAEASAQFQDRDGPAFELAEGHFSWALRVLDTRFCL